MTGAKKIITWNTGGLKDITRRQKKVELIRNILEKANETLFIGLQETHWTEDTDVPQLFKNLKNLYWFRYGHAPANDNFSGIAIIVNKIFTIISHEVMIEGRLTHTKLQRLYNSEVYNIFCYYGYTGQKKTYENNIKHVDLAR